MSFVTLLYYKLRTPLKIESSVQNEIITLETVARVSVMSKYGECRNDKEILFDGLDVFYLLDPYE